MSESLNRSNCTGCIELIFFHHYENVVGMLYTNISNIFPHPQKKRSQIFDISMHIYRNYRTFASLFDQKQYLFILMPFIQKLLCCTEYEFIEHINIECLGTFIWTKSNFHLSFQFEVAHISQPIFIVYIFSIV